MSAADEDTELRDLVAQTLHQQGVLSKIKAQLRASIFLALDEHDSGKLNESKSPSVNHKLKNFLSTEHGIQTVSIVADFLQFFDLDYTNSVFGPELNMRESTEFLSSNEMRESFDLPHSDAEPILSQLLKRKENLSERIDEASAKQGGQQSHHSEKPDPPALGPSFMDRGFMDFDDSLDKRDGLMGSFSYEESPRSPKRQQPQPSNNFSGLGDLPPLNPQKPPKEDGPLLSARGEDKSFNEGTAGGHMSEAYEDDFGSSANSINFGQSNKSKSGTGQGMTGGPGGVTARSVERSEISEDLDEEIEEDEEDEEEISETGDNEEEEEEADAEVSEARGGSVSPGVSRRNDITSDHSVSRLSDTELDYAEDVTR